MNPIKMKPYLAVVEGPCHERLASRQCQTILAAKQFCTRNMDGQADRFVIYSARPVCISDWKYDVIIATKTLHWDSVWTDTKKYKTYIAKETVLGFLYSRFEAWTWFEQLVRHNDNDTVINRIMARYEGENFYGTPLTAEIFSWFAEYVLPRIAKKIRKTESPIICAN